MLSPEHYTFAVYVAPVNQPDKMVVVRQGLDGAQLRAIIDVYRHALTTDTGTLRLTWWDVANPKLLA